MQDDSNGERYMPNAIFTFNTGRKQMLNQRHAELLRRLGKGSYITRDMADQPTSSTSRVLTVPNVVTAARFLLIGPIWVLAKLYRQFGWKY